MTDLAPSLSTHVLDTAHGVPAAGMRLTLYRGAERVFEGLTDNDGRCADLRRVTLTKGLYRLEFETAAYFRAVGVRLSDPPFFDVIGIDFGLDAGHVHVPLLVSPYSYSTYRGS